MPQQLNCLCLLKFLVGNWCWKIIFIIFFLTKWRGAIFTRYESWFSLPGLLEAPHIFREGTIHCLFNDLYWVSRHYLGYRGCSNEQIRQNRQNYLLSYMMNNKNINNIHRLSRINTWYYKRVGKGGRECWVDQRMYVLGSGKVKLPFFPKPKNKILDVQNGKIVYSWPPVTQLPCYPTYENRLEVMHAIW